MKNKALKIITSIIGIILIISLCSLDSESIVPFFVCAGCLAWIVPFLKANNIIGGFTK